MSSDREVLQVFDYKNVKSQSVHNAQDDSRVIQQQRDNDILIYRQGGSGMDVTAPWTHLATLVKSQMGGFELIDENESFLQDDFDIYEYLASVETEPAQEYVSFTEIPTEHRKLTTAPLAPAEVAIGYVGSTTVRVYHSAATLNAGAPTVTKYQLQFQVNSGTFQAAVDCPGTSATF
jgi:hypothetical protein